MGNWRDGVRGAFAMGMRHGTYCLGCCWALMGVLFVVGVMNLVWVGVLTVFVLLEKIGPTGVRLARTGGAIMIALGVIMVSTGCPRAARPPDTRRATRASRPDGYLLGSYRIATAPEPNSSRLTSFKSTRFDSPANNVGPWPASLGCTTNSYSSINPAASLQHDGDACAVDAA